MEWSRNKNEMYSFYTQFDSLTVGNSCKIKLFFLEIRFCNVKPSNCVYISVHSGRASQSVSEKRTAITKNLMGSACVTFGQVAPLAEIRYFLEKLKPLLSLRVEQSTLNVVFSL
jgi:hypothetical protein